jgi:hypothetical protein
MQIDVRAATQAHGLLPVEGLAIGNLPGAKMDARMRSAAQCLQELRGAPTIETCHAAAVLAGMSLIDADECDDGACCCPQCPWRRTAANWRARPGSASSANPRGLP